MVRDISDRLVYICAVDIRVWSSKGRPGMLMPPPTTNTSKLHHGPTLTCNIPGKYAATDRYSECSDSLQDVRPCVYCAGIMKREKIVKFNIRRSRATSTKEGSLLMVFPL